MPAQIDPTSVVLFAAGSVAIALVLCFVFRRHKRGDAAIKWLIISNCALLAAAFGILLRSRIGFDVASGLVLGGMFCAICSAYFAVLRAVGRTLPLRLVGGFAATAIVTHLAIAQYGGSLTSLMISSSLINSALLLYVCVTIWSATRWYGRRMSALLCIPFATVLAGYASRPLKVLIWGDGDHLLIGTLVIIVAMSWSAVILELGLIALRERQAQMALRDALDKVQKASAARTRFLLSISHDLRTPLNAVIGLAELMKSQTMGPLPAAYQQHADLIHQNGGDLMEMVSDLLVAASEGEDDLTDDTTGAIKSSVAAKFSEHSGTTAEGSAPSQAPALPDKRTA
ncbi:MAG: histidine kinase dimerization/phospho-acceptor domain-containing protein [Pseudomonadota bacterium]